MENQQTCLANVDHHFTKIVYSIGLLPEFFDEYQAEVAERFGEALLFFWQGGDRSSVRTHAINRCLHIASSVVQLGSDPFRLKRTIDGLAPFARTFGSDDSVRYTVPTLITVAALAHLFNVIEERRLLVDGGLSAKLNQIRPTGVPVDYRYVNELRSLLKSDGWVVGFDIARKLGLEC
jgi:hypothetical protein